MARGEAPQTIAEAMEWGWEWLAIKCLSCPHQGHLKFTEVSDEKTKAKIADVASKLKCQSCDGRVTQISLGRWEHGGGQPVNQSRRIAFEGSMTVPASRE